MRKRERVFEIQEVDGKLHIERSGKPFRKRYVVLLTVLLAVMVLLIGYLAASQLNPRFWMLVALIFLLLLVVSERTYRMYQATKPIRYVMDSEGDRIERNGERVAGTEGIEAILFREVFDGDRSLNEYAVVVYYENTRRLLVAESAGLPGEEQEFRVLADRLGAYFGVPVRDEPRQADQYWLDRS